ncbi:MAG: transporter [Planctomycetia bacterium]|nr:transporter [Planctomycetia bacterium]
MPKKNGEKDDKKHSNGDSENGNEPENDVIATDRPDFTEASSTVGRNRIQLESGYTYSRNREAGVQNQHSYPEALFRIGMFADWFEWRIAQNYSSTHMPGAVSQGPEDLYVGVKLALTEQKEYMPESALIIQATVPTGSDNTTTGKTLPGMNYLFGWDITDKISMGGSIQGNAAVTDSGHSYLELAQSLTVGYAFTEKLGSYMEVFGIEPFSGNAPDIGPYYFFDGGFTYKFTPNFQYDIRAGVGLNKQSDDFFVGAGFAVRF